MRLVEINDIQIGMKLARSVYGPSGDVFLKESVEIKPHYVPYLKKMGINKVYIQDSRITDIKVDDIISEDTRNEARRSLDIIMKEVKGLELSEKRFNVENQLVITASRIIEELIKNDQIVIQLSEMKSQGDYLIGHGINVTTLSIIIMMKMKIPRERINRLAAGFLLHDIGYVAIPEEIVKKKGPLTDEERDIVQTHPVLGFEILKNTKLYSLGAGNIIHQHHERATGQGYPQKLSIGNISVPARIAAVADVYDAMISNRPYRKAWPPHKALSFMLKEGSKLFDTEVLRALFSFIAAYPVGTQVTLSNGDSGFVVGNTPGYTFNPKVKVLFKGEKKNKHPQPYEVDLATNLDIVVSDVIETK